MAHWVGFSATAGRVSVDAGCWVRDPRLLSLGWVAVMIVLSPVFARAMSTTLSFSPAPLFALLLVAGAFLAMAGCSPSESAPGKRFAMVIGLKPDKIERYKELHADPWPGVLARISECNIRNYSIHLAELEPGKHYLFGYFEYVGDDFLADMNKMAADEETVRWWAETDPCQTPIATAGEGTKWAEMEEVFFLP